MTKVKPRRPYDKTVPHQITFPTKTMTKQSFKDECDINTIMSKYQTSGLIEHVQKVQGSYGDFTSVQDYQLSLNQVIAAQEAFDALPAVIRERFANDPSRLMSFLQDDKNIEEARRLGLVEPEVAPPPPTPPQPKGPEGRQEPPGKEATQDQGTKSPPPNKGP